MNNKKNDRIKKNRAQNVSKNCKPCTTATAIAMVKSNI